MTVLIDTNVLIDFLLHRSPYDKDATVIMEKCAKRNIQGYIAFHSVSNIFFILRKYADAKTRRDMLKKLCKMVTVTAASHEEVEKAIDRIQLESRSFLCGNHTVCNCCCLCCELM